MTIGAKQQRYIIKPLIIPRPNFSEPPRPLYNHICERTAHPVNIEDTFRISIPNKPYSNQIFHRILRTLSSPHGSPGSNHAPHHYAETSPHKGLAAVDSELDDCVIGYVTGWRIWRVGQAADNSLCLSSPVMKLPWPHGRAMKGLVSQPPQGVYAFTQCIDPQLLARRWIERQGAALGGQVALWGQVNEHEEGWTAQFAYPLSLDWLPTHCSDCGKIMDGDSLSKSEQQGLILQSSRHEFFVLCTHCCRHHAGKAIVSTSNSSFTGTQWVLSTLRTAYLPYLTIACKQSNFFGQIPPARLSPATD